MGCRNTPSIFLSKGEAISLRRSNGHHDISADSPTSANPVSSKENMFYNASASSLNKLQNKLNISLHSLELLQEELHREDKVTLFEAKRTWLFARRLADLYGGWHFFERGRDQA